MIDRSVVKRRDSTDDCLVDKIAGDWWINRKLCFRQHFALLLINW